MQIIGLGLPSYQARAQTSAKKDGSPQVREKSSAMPDTAISSTQEAKTASKEDTVENFKSYMLNRYKKYGLVMSGGPVAAKHGVAPSFSVDPKAMEQAANDPEKARELDDLLHSLTTIGSNLFNQSRKPLASLGGGRLLAIR